MLRPLRSMRACFVVLSVLVATVFPSSAALAAPNEWICVGVPDAGFTDVDPTSAHKPDIDCLKFFDITSGTTPTTYDPKGAVNRWQMALFMMRTNGFEQLSGSDRGFVDILGLSADSQKAINQIAQLGITTGTSPTTYDPNGTVSRWQMALFLTRLVTAEGVILPNGSGQGFTDISGLSAAYQTAINQLAQLGITSGTSATTYGPDGLVTREQMASFLVRTFQIIWTLGVGAEAGVCTPPLPADPNAGSITPGTVCVDTGIYPPGVTFTVRPAWFSELPFLDAADETAFRSVGTRVEIWLNETQQVTSEKVVSLPGVELRKWEAVFPGGLSGFHIFETRWYYDGQLILTDQVTIDFS